MTRNQLIIASYLAGESGHALAPRFGVTGARIYQILARYGVEIRLRSEMSDERRNALRERMRALQAQGRLEQFPERNAAIVALRKSGIGPREIARRFGLSPSTIAGVLHRKGETTEPFGRGFGVSAKVRRAAVADAGRMTYAEAAALHGVSPTSVVNWVRGR